MRYGDSEHSFGILRTPSIDSPGRSRTILHIKLLYWVKYTHMCIFSLCHGIPVPSSQPVTCANIGAQFYFKNVSPPTPASKMIFGLLWFREKRFQVHMCTGYLVTDAWSLKNSFFRRFFNFFLIFFTFCNFFQNIFCSRICMTPYSESTENFLSFGI